MDCVTELLQFGDKGRYYGAVNFTLTEAFILGPIACAGSSVPCVYTNLNDSHLLSM